jgi:hypothetical protein
VLNLYPELASEATYLLLLHNGENRLASNYYNKVWTVAQELDWSCKDIQRFLKDNFNTHHAIAIKKLDKLSEQGKGTRKWTARKN